MRVILLSDQRDLGKRGEVVDVKPGFGRSYLLPQGLALEATEANVTYFERQQQKIDARHAQEQRAGEVPEPSRWDDLLGPFYSTSQAAQLCGGISLQELEDRKGTTRDSGTEDLRRGSGLSRLFSSMSRTGFSRGSRIFSSVFRRGT